MYCSSKTIATRIGNTGHAYPLRCKRWSCPTCAPRRRKKLINEAVEGKPTRFVTLTCNPAWFESPEERAREMVKAWRDFVREGRRLGKWKEMEYLAVLELTKLGEPHIHLVCRSSRISQAELSNWMAKRMGAPVVDVRMVKGHAEVAKYVSKYISKRPISLGNLKRYWRSQKYLPMTAKEKKALRKAAEAVWIIDMDRDTYRKLLATMGKFIYARFPDDISWTLYPWEGRPPGSEAEIRRLR